MLQPIQEKSYHLWKGATERGSAWRAAGGVHGSSELDTESHAAHWLWGMVGMPVTTLGFPLLLPRL